MMTRRHYHYLVAGLPGIYNGERLWTGIPEFKNHLEVHLHPEDFILVKYVLLQHDHQNLLHFLDTGDFPVETAGNFTMEDFYNPEDHNAGSGQAALFMPDYLFRILSRHAENSGSIVNMGSTGNKVKPDLPALQKELDEGFFSFIMENGNDFLRRYYSFHYDLNNLLTYITTGAHKRNQEEYITGSTPHAQHLRELAGRNLVRDPDLEQFDEILSISEKTSFAEQEKAIDQLRWRVIDDFNLFEYFTIDRILGYLLQMHIAARWEQLDRTSGEKQLRRLIDVSYRRLADEQQVQQQALV